MEQAPFQQSLSNLAIIIQQGKILDFIDGRTQRPDTPEEYVRQEIAKSLVREYRMRQPILKWSSLCAQGLGSRGPIS